MFKLFAFFAVLAVAFAAPAPAPAPAPQPGAVLAAAAPIYSTYAALPLASSSQSIIRNHNALGYAYGSYPLAYQYPTYLL